MVAESSCRQQPPHSIILEVDRRGFDRETLLVNWLNEILYLQETRDEGITDSEILEISDVHLKARLHVERIVGAGVSSRL